MCVCGGRGVLKKNLAKSWRVRQEISRSKKKQPAKPQGAKLIRLIKRQAEGRQRKRRSPKNDVKTKLANVTPDKLCDFRNKLPLLTVFDWLT